MRNVATIRTSEKMCRNALPLKASALRGIVLSRWQGLKRPSEISDGLWFYQISDLILRFKPGCSESLNSGSLPIFSLAV